MTFDRYGADGSGSTSVTDAGVSVIGTGSATAAVNCVTVTLAVEITRADAGEAFRVAAAAVTKLLAVLSDHGVDARSVRTADLALGPRYEFADGQQRQSGYQASQRLIVSIEGLSTVDTMLTDVATRASEGLRIEQLRLAADNPREAASDARTAAMIDAREQALSLAVLAGRPLGPVVLIAVAPEHVPGPIALAAHTTREVSTMPVATGDTSVTVSVHVHFAWAD